jgi:hypothetical protein
MRSAVSTASSIPNCIQSPRSPARLAAQVFGDRTDRTRVSTSWDGDRLVIEIRHPSGSPAQSPSSEHKAGWSLNAAQGTLLLTVTDKAPDGKPSLADLIYRRQVV